MYALLYPSFRACQILFICLRQSLRSRKRIHCLAFYLPICSPYAFAESLYVLSDARYVVVLRDNEGNDGLEQILIQYPDAVSVFVAPLSSAHSHKLSLYLSVVGSKIEVIVPEFSVSSARFYVSLPSSKADSCSIASGNSGVPDLRSSSSGRHLKTCPHSKIWTGLKSYIIQILFFNSLYFIFYWPCSFLDMRSFVILCYVAYSDIYAVYGKCGHLGYGIMNILLKCQAAVDRAGSLSTLTSMVTDILSCLPLLILSTTTRESSYFLALILIMSLITCSLISNVPE